jgi:hypothetical protein
MRIRQNYGTFARLLLINELVLDKILQAKLFKSFQLTFGSFKANSEKLTSSIHRTATVLDFAVQRLLISLLQESHVTQLTYDLPRTGASWSQLFGTVEDLVPLFNIIDYSLSQTTLEQVFIEFSKRSDVDQFQPVIAQSPVYNV